MLSGHRVLMLRSKLGTACAPPVSKGTVVREISMLRCAMDHPSQRVPRIFPVEVCPDPHGNGVMISDVTSRDDFHTFVKGEGQNPHAALAHLMDLAL